MAIFVPPKADPDLLRSLRDIEQQLNELSRDEATPVADNRELLSRLDTIESRLNNLNQFEHVSQPIADYKNDGNPSRVLHEDGTWLEPLAGIAKAVPPTLSSSRTRPTNLVNVLGSLAVTGAMSADTVRTRLLHHRLVGCHAHRSTDLSVTTGAPVAISMNVDDWDPYGFHSVSLNTHQFTVPIGYSGWYYCMLNVRWAANNPGTGEWHVLRIEQGTGSPATGNIIGITSSADIPGGSAPLDVHCSAIAYLGEGDTVQVYASTGHNETISTLATKHVLPYFQMVRVGM